MQQMEIHDLLVEKFGPRFLTQEEIDNPFGIKEAIEKQAAHKTLKMMLGDRVQVLRVLIIKKFKDKRMQMTEWEFLTRVERQLDNMLAKNKYQLESLIAKLSAEIV